MWRLVVVVGVGAGGCAMLWEAIGVPSALAFAVPCGLMMGAALLC